ncbi:MAG: FAD-dependent thymidylate synthase [Terriglobales bacterium]
MANADRPQPQPAPSTEVYAVFGVEPEVQAYAMAKYSRSALSMKQSLAELSEQKAERFLNTFYFQYGHRSIADLAHIAMAIERLSLLAAIAVVDEQRWDGQERSTRYQDFSRPDYYVPDFGGDKQAEARYREPIEGLFAAYREVSPPLVEYLKQHAPKPSAMAADFYERTVRARAFDIARYLLPLATNTSLGQIVSARTLENQVARLLADTHPEVREVGLKLKQAARSAAYIPQREWLRSFIDELGDFRPDFAQEARDQLLKEVRVAPTLVKYADANSYLSKTREELQEAAAELMRGVEVAAEESGVALLEDEPIEIELAATLLYEHCHHPYRQVRGRVEAMSAAQRKEIVDLGVKHRGAHDELLRAYCGGHGFRFDILMDIGGYRDLHRHRRCIQIGQGFTPKHGYDTPEEFAAAGVKNTYDRAMKHAGDVHTEIAGSAADAADYVLPLGYRKRTLFKMDFAEVVYITELRTAPAGHFSYRRIAWEMYEAVARRHPELAGYFRVHDPREKWDLLQR